MEERYYGAKSTLQIVITESEKTSMSNDILESAKRWYLQLFGIAIDYERKAVVPANRRFVKTTRLIALKAVQEAHHSFWYLEIPVLSSQR
jgi:hypothetical protein